MARQDSNLRPTDYEACTSGAEPCSTRVSLPVRFRFLLL